MAGIGAGPPPEFVQAILVSFDPQSNPTLRGQASSSLEALRQSDDGWAFCMQAFGSAVEEQVKFWCLQTVIHMVTKKSRYAQLPAEQRCSLQRALVAWLQARGGAETDEPASVKNKFAQLFVAVLKADFPLAWPDAFSQLLCTLGNGLVAIDMFLRVLNELHEQVVVHEESNGYDSETATRVKDGMRDRCLAQVADAWYSILQLHSTAPALCAACLHTVHLHVAWIPIELVANPRWFGTLRPFLHHGALHDGASLVLKEIVEKRMDAANKMEHLTELRIVPMLTEAAGSGVQTSPRFGALVAALCLELLDCWDRLAGAAPPSARAAMLVPRAVEMLQQTLPLLLQTLACDDMETSHTTLAFLHSYVGRLRKLLPSQRDLAAHEGQLQALLLVLGQRCVYPDDFDFESPDEAEEAFLAYRRELSTLFKGVARVHATLAQEMCRSTLLRTLERLGEVPWTHLEVALWLLYTLGEGLPESMLRQKGGFFEQLMATLTASSASAYPHRAVQLMSFELNVRYYRFFLANPEHLPAALATFLDGRGIYNGDREVRARACYLLLRFVKQTLKDASAAAYSEVARTLHVVLAHQRTEHSPYTQLLEQLYAAEGRVPPPAPAPPFFGDAHARASGLQLPEPPQLSAPEALNLFEAYGLLLGARLAPADQVGEQLQRLLALPMAHLQALTQGAAQGVPPGLSTSLSAEMVRQLRCAREVEAAHHISAVALTSKGFVDVGVNDEGSHMLRDAFSRATQAVIASMSVFGESAEVRAKCSMLLHRMIETLGVELLGVLSSALPQLLGAADARELVELVTLVNQLVLKFKSSILAPVTVLFCPLSTTVFAHLGALDAAIATSSSASVGATGPASEPVRERRNLLRCFYSLLHSLVHSDLADVLAAPQNSAHAAPSLRALLAGCIEGPDMQLQRQCFAITQRLVELWVGTVPGFDTYVLHEVLPVCFQAPAQPHFMLKDAAALPLLEASAQLQKAILAKLGNELLSYLRDRLLPSLGCEATFCTEYVRRVAEGDVHQLRDFIRDALVRR